MSKDSQENSICMKTVNFFCNLTRLHLPIIFIQHLFRNYIYMDLPRLNLILEIRLKLSQLEIDIADHMLKKLCFGVHVWHLIHKLSTNKQASNITSRITSRNTWSNCWKIKLNLEICCWNKDSAVDVSTFCCCQCKLGVKVFVFGKL